MKTYYFASPTTEAEKIGTTGRLFKKQVLPLGDWVDPLYPGERMTFTREFFEQMVDNFKKAVAGRVPTPDTHTDETSANKGEVVDLEIADDGLYAYIDIRDEDTAEGIDRGTTWDVSAKFTDNYQDTKHGIWHGPALLHVALVNNPYIKKMNPFTALAESLHNQHGAAVRALSESQANNKEETMKVTNDRDFPVEVTHLVDEEEQKVTLQPGDELEVSEDQAEAVKTQLTDAVAPETQHEETDEEKAAREAEEAEAAKRAEEDAEAKRQADEAAKGGGKTEELSDTARELAETKHKLAMRDIDDRYKELLGQGKIVPAMEKPFKELSEAVAGQSRELSDGATVSLSDVLTRFIESMPKIVSLDDEKGKTEDDTQKSPWQQLSDQQREKLQASGVSEESYNANGGKNGLSVAALTGKKD